MLTEEMQDLWDRYITAMAEADTDALRSLHHPAAKLIHMTGHVASLDEWLAGIANREFVYHRIVVHSVTQTETGLEGYITTGVTDDGSGYPWPLHIVMTIRDGLVTESQVFLDR